MKDLVLVLGDQLSPGLPGLRQLQPGDADILMAEVTAETEYVWHHRKKIAFIFSAMRHFAGELRAAGRHVIYRAFDETPPCPELASAVADALAAGNYKRLILTEPGEWRLRAEMESWEERFGLPVIILEDDRFICSHDDFNRWADGRKQLRMEYFYREMRQRTGLLMEGGKPAGGRWNFDSENRKPASGNLFMPQPFGAEPDAITRDVLDLVEARFPDGFGDLRPFRFAVTRADAEKALDHFIATALKDFGDYQDAMLKGEAFLYHSVLSAYINAGLLDPLDVCRRAEAAWQAGEAPLNAVEGFIRQIIGWREYVRGIYWREGPDYVRRNALEATRPLPDFYWSGETDMACLAAAIGQTRREAYAHHIQRLMVTGTFALIAGIDPHALHEWYLAVYIDAFEWVEAPNTIGMSQFADGGLLGSKPYAASGAYIDRMSDYCAGCRYDVKDKTGPKSCPFNALYWDFLDRNADRLRGNPRLGPVYKNWDRMDEAKRQAYRDRAEAVLKGL
ncbi:cryptochrome/photolyase family protein [Maricaulis virginensis]|uniref:Deoxyribodipyrimidine photo-lyase n=1 Tax=Maricaulis virginensis TaxID=144022 RepID=A0A9W6MMA5_9PROT|nr:cryptochrome/photolyase family protein [Maricaulis virginensis]GLK50773.1 deoxyribodipyrimidine photo-lyase [Maricaulis virginensis]